MQKTYKKYFPIFVLPTLIAFIISFIIPFFMGLYLSFCNFKTIGSAKFTGLSNYLCFFRYERVPFSFMVYGKGCRCRRGIH